MRCRPPIPLCPGGSPLADQKTTVARDTSFYYSFLVLPQAKRDAIVAVWDFCRAVDDTVDEPGHVPPAEALASWRQELARCYEGAPETPQGRALQPFIRQFHLPKQPFSDLIDGVEMDVSTCRYATFPALYRYCWRVASTVGLICIEIFGCTRPESREYAINLGVALQLTNIVRDIATDFRRGRIYLPQDDLARFDVTEADLEAGRPVDRVQRADRVRVRTRTRILPQGCGAASSRGREASRRRRDHGRYLPRDSRSRRTGAVRRLHVDHPRPAAPARDHRRDCLAAIAGRTRCRILTSSSSAADSRDSAQPLLLPTPARASPCAKRGRDWAAVPQRSRIPRRASVSTTGSTC